MYLGYDYDGCGTPYARSHQFVMGYVIDMISGLKDLVENILA